jgi:hypothetical protein
MGESLIPAGSGRDICTSHLFSCVDHFVLDLYSSKAAFYRCLLHHHHHHHHHQEWRLTRTRQNTARPLRTGFPRQKSCFAQSMRGWIIVSANGMPQ